MMESLIDSALGIAKESIKTFSQEAFNNTIKLINGFSAMLLALLPGKTSLLEGIQGWELRPTLRAPGMPKWMESGVSSFNEFIHEYAADSDSESEPEYESGVDDDSSLPPSPSSQTSHWSRTSTVHRKHPLLRRFVRLLFWPFISWTQRDREIRRRHISHSRSGSAGSLTSLYSLASRRLNSMKDFVMLPMTDSRRRGVIEDLQLLVELSIEKVFEVMHSAVYHFFSPLETLKTIFRRLIFDYQTEPEVAVEPKAVLGDTDPSLTLRPVSHSRQRLNTDARTCEDIITELGYPYEAFRVTTEDGYILLLERIPRKNSRKAVYLQHGIFDSSLGWVANGVVGSQAFAAYDQGYDVFLGNFRGLVSRDHVDKNISSKRYWRYSVNEHGTQDVPAMLDKIHELKTKELEQVEDDTPLTPDETPYKLCGIAHSLGGAALLMYVVIRRLEGRPHRLSRLVLLSPAGFHEEAPAICYIFQYFFPLLSPILRPLVPGFYVPTKFLRMVFNKLARDFQNYPALGGLVQLLCGYVVGGDSSNWVGALGCTHYNMDDMPGVAYMVAEHLAQMMRSKRFVMFDFGSVSANMEAYGTPEPLDVGAHYGVIDIPVDIVAGKKDKLIPRSMVRRHYETLKEAGCQTSYREFEYAHLDFTFSHRDELLAYVMSRLLLVTSPDGDGSRRRTKKSSSTNESRKLHAKLVKRTSDPRTGGGEGCRASWDGEVVVKQDVPEEAEHKNLLVNGSLFSFPAREIAFALSREQDGEQQQQQQQHILPSSRSAPDFASAKDCLEGLSQEEMDELSATLERTM